MEVSADVYLSTNITIDCYAGIQRESRSAAGSRPTETAAGRRGRHTFRDAATACKGDIAS